MQIVNSPPRMAKGLINGEGLKHPDPGNGSNPGGACPTGMEAQIWEQVQNLERARQRYRTKVMKRGDTSLYYGN